MASYNATSSCLCSSPRGAQLMYTSKLNWTRQAHLATPACPLAQQLQPVIKPLDCNHQQLPLSLFKLRVMRLFIDPNVITCTTAVM